MPSLHCRNQIHPPIVVDGLPTGRPPILKISSTGDFVKCVLYLVQLPDVGAGASSLLLADLRAAEITFYEERILPMKKFSQPTETEAMVVFADLARFYRVARGMGDRELFDWMSAYFEMAGDIVEGAGGVVIKTIGDALLVVFPEECVDCGVLALVELQSRTSQWMEERGYPCQLIVKAHFGPVVLGPIGTRKDKRLDVYGQTVNNAARLVSHGLSLSQQLFRKLSKETRKSFKKHSAPYYYIPVNERHSD